MSTNGKILSLGEIANLIDKAQPTCHCGAILRGSGLNHYGPHDGGIRVEGYPDKRWVYVTCVCGYDMALWKIVHQMNRNLENPELIKNVGKENEMSEWNGNHGIVKAEKNHYWTKCAHPTCGTHPELKLAYLVGGIPIGRCCIRKGEWRRLDQ